jgi:hypothetical protein
MGATASACSLFDPVPGRQLDLQGTSWTIVDIDGMSVDSNARPVISFPSGAVQERVAVDTGCRVTTVEFALDTDGSALGFGPPTESPPPCEPTRQDQDTKVIEALRGIESWVVLSNDEIEFAGSHGIRLRRTSPPASSET